MSNNLNNFQDFKFSHAHQDNDKKEIEIPENYVLYIERGKSYYINCVKIAEKYLKISKINWWYKIKNKNVKKNYLMLAEILGVNMDNYKDSMDFYVNNKYKGIKDHNINKIYRNFYKLKYINNCNILSLELYKKRVARANVELCDPKLCECNIDNYKNIAIYNNITAYSDVIKNMCLISRKNLPQLPQLPQVIITNIIEYIGHAKCIYCIDTCKTIDCILSHNITNCRFFNEQSIDKRKVKKCQICEDLGNVKYVNTHHTNKCFDKSNCVLINGMYHQVDDYYGNDDNEAEMRCHMRDENTEKDDEHDYDY